MKTILISVLAVLFLSAALAAQPRPMDRPSQNAKKAPAPESFAAKYEGGMYGYSEKHEGELKFDDVNARLVFFGEDRKELFTIPYSSLLVIYPQSKSVTSTAGNVVSHIPLPGAGLAGFIKQKRRYLILQIDDPDVDIRGAINFKLENKELLDSVLETLAAKAGLRQRGDAYYRPRNGRPAV
jgi:hypothetical protein